MPLCSVSGLTGSAQSILDGLTSNKLTSDRLAPVKGFSSVVVGTSANAASRAGRFDCSVPFADDQSNFGGNLQPAGTSHSRLTQNALQTGPSPTTFHRPPYDRMDAPKRIDAVKKMGADQGALNGAGAFLPERFWAKSSVVRLVESGWPTEGSVKAGDATIFPAPRARKFISDPKGNGLVLRQGIRVAAMGRAPIGMNR
jgi:hypothetical protein